MDTDFPVDLFYEPDGYRAASPEPTFHKFTQKNGRDLCVTLIAQHSLWAHCLWNAGIFLAKYLETNTDSCAHKNILELGAAAALPSLVAALNNANKVVITDYPDDPIIHSIEHNVAINIPDEHGRVFVMGYLWGQDCAPLLEPLQGERFDVIIMSDLIFNHTEHTHLLETVISTLAHDGKVLVAFSHHRPHMAARDMKFFDIARSLGFSIEHVQDAKMDAMFEDDPGDLDVRQTIHFYQMRRMTEE